MCKWFLVIVGMVGLEILQADPFAGGDACPTATLADYAASSGECQFAGISYSAFSAGGTLTASNILITPTLGLGAASSLWAGRMFGFVLTGVRGPIYSTDGGPGRLTFSYQINAPAYHPFVAAEYGITAQGAHGNDFEIDTGISTSVNGIRYTFPFVAESVYYDAGADGRLRQVPLSFSFGDIAAGLTAGRFPTNYTVTTSLYLNASNDGFTIESLDQESMILLTPEPATFGLLGVGLVALAMARRRRAAFLVRFVDR